MSGLELREARGVLTLIGLASRTEVDYQVADFTERIARGAFRKTLAAGPKVRLLIEHRGLPLAHTQNDTLKLGETSDGLIVKATMDASRSDVKDAAAAIRRGDVAEMSFAFKALAQTWTKNHTHRLIREATIDGGDVSIVGAGANPETTVSVRGKVGELELRRCAPLPRSHGSPGVWVPSYVDTARARLEIARARGRKAHGMTVRR